MCNIKTFINSNKEFMYSVFEELCKIPAPSGNEEKRAEYCKKLLDSFGLQSYIDDVLNVVCPINCENSNNITVVVAHTDTVFPDTNEMPYTEKDGKIYCPGVGDDTACLITLLMAAKYFKEGKHVFPDGLLLVCNSCEEGLGNLKGTREIMKAYKGRVKQFLSLDGKIENIADKCVGSHRYNVCVKTIGGHSWGNFGNKNAIAEAAKIIEKIYSLPLPKHGDDKTSYNVGTISGGTSVNTIAQDAEFLCEYRSESVVCLNEMKIAFENIFKTVKNGEVAVEYTMIAERPCAAEGLDESVAKLSTICESIITEVTGIVPNYHSSSTDCNIPLSMGIPSLCIGTYRGGGEHTREEWAKKDSILAGTEIAIRVIEKITEV